LTRPAKSVTAEVAGAPDVRSFHVGERVLMICKVG
jgi:hypothetical protein